MLEDPLGLQSVRGSSILLHINNQYLTVMMQLPSYLQILHYNPWYTESYNLFRVLQLYFAGLTKLSLTVLAMISLSSSFQVSGVSWVHQRALRNAGWEQYELRWSGITTGGLRSLDGGQVCLYLQAKWWAGSSSGLSPSDTPVGRVLLAKSAAHYSSHPERGEHRKNIVSQKQTIDKTTYMRKGSGDPLALNSDFKTDRWTMDF